MNKEPPNKYRQRLIPKQRTLLTCFPLATKYENVLQCMTDVNHISGTYSHTPVIGVLKEYVLNYSIHLTTLNSAA